MFKSWQALTLWKRVLVGLVPWPWGLGLAVRYGTPESVNAETTLSGFERAAAIGDTWFKPFGDAFVRLIKNADHSVDRYPLWSPE